MQNAYFIRGRIRVNYRLTQQRSIRMNGIWLHFMRYFQAPSGMATLDSCRIVEALIPMAELYGSDLQQLVADERRVEDQPH
ncbi:hypothetical protein ETA_12420 [Erwinia tasmaniensis Et1/99]|uniref:Uncharacterized protein n=2 Tax=Erwinia tasmaniensis TaxID=338565 RepID=B2VIK1_ERWT9|nr:hypothetical protein ETA_12420 [Erwinia tasmaniensis Et1/99]